MQKIFALLMAMSVLAGAKAQTELQIFVKDQSTLRPVAGATVFYQGQGNITDSLGYALVKINGTGRQEIRISYTGYTDLSQKITPLTLQQGTVVVMLQTKEDDLEEVVIQSTRTSRTIANTPTRVETIDGEELDEKNNMRPANVSMLLHESTGLQVQQTSATSGNASIRVQGLDGRYTQLLKDGYPNFGNFASGLSILEIPPLDLKQVEVIKGPASTLYGGGAIAGVINFISKTPEEKFEGDLLFNQSNVGQTNIGGYISGRQKKFGYSLLGLVNFQQLYDVDNDDFSELPKNNNFTIHPRLFFYPNPSTGIMIGNSFTTGNITGGDIQFIKGNATNEHTYFEKNKTTRNSSTLEVDKKISTGSSLKLKQSLSIFDRSIAVPGYSFAGLNTNSFTDLSYITQAKAHTVIAGLNYVYDHFNQKDINELNNQTNTAGAYVQDTWDATEAVTLEGGLRMDHVRFQNNNYDKKKTFLLPRFSALVKLSNKISSRIGGGLGYKIPTVFTEQTESMQYQQVKALSNVEAEKSVGGTADINYKTTLFPHMRFSVNQMFFYTRIKDPLVLQQDLAGDYSFFNAGQPVISRGFETNLKFIYRNDLKLFVGYTFTNAKATYLSAKQFLPLLPKNKLNLTLMYEKEDNFKFGLEGYFTDKQFLSNGNGTPSYWEFGFMAQKTFNKISLFINFENFTDQRQSRYDRVVNPPHNNPTFDEVWNHTEGFVVNGGIKLEL